MQVTPETPYSELRERLRLIFGIRSQPVDALSSFFDRARRPEESVSSYLCELHSLAAAAFPTMGYAEREGRVFQLAIAKLPSSRLRRRHGHRMNASTAELCRALEEDPYLDATIGGPAKPSVGVQVLTCCSSSGTSYGRPFRRDYQPRPQFQQRAQQDNRI